MPQSIGPHDFFMNAYAGSLRGRYADRIIVVASFVLGLACRYAARNEVTDDTFKYLLPWYETAHELGLASLGLTFTNYTPFYSYLLLAVTELHGLFKPWHLIKAISFFFEFGCSVVAARLVSTVGTGGAHAPAFAFAAVWLAPTVLFNGAVWGQGDALWTLFVLLSVYFFCRDWPLTGTIAFAAALSIKAQAIFLGPFILALVLRRTIHWMWLVTIPAVYLVIASPAWLFGQSLIDIFSVYIKQVGTFHLLSMNAANLWLYVPNTLYGIGVPTGMVLAAGAGLSFAVYMARSKLPLKSSHLVIAAAVSLLLTPFLLPKMHDRYFYAFEVMAIVLACLHPRLIPIALAAQLNGVLAYLAYYGIAASLLPIAALGNAWILIELGLFAKQKLTGPGISDAAAFSPALFMAALGAFWASFGLLLSMRG
jgi:Gpi18-like mannosyltransferase